MRGILHRTIALLLIPAIGLTTVNRDPLYVISTARYPITDHGSLITDHAFQSQALAAAILNARRPVSFPRRMKLSTLALGMALAVFHPTTSRAQPLAAEPLAARNYESILRALIPIAIPAALLALYHFGLIGGPHAALAFAPFLLLRDQPPASTGGPLPKTLDRIIRSLGNPGQRLHYELDAKIKETGLIKGNSNEYRVGYVPFQLSEEGRAFLASTFGATSVVTDGYLLTFESDHKATQSSLNGFRRLPFGIVIKARGVKVYDYQKKSSDEIGLFDLTPFLLNSKHLSGRLRTVGLAMGQSLFGLENHRGVETQTQALQKHSMTLLPDFTGFDYLTLYSPWFEDHPASSFPGADRASLHSGVFLPEHPQSEDFQRTLIQHQAYVRGQPVHEIGAGSGINALWSAVLGAASYSGTEPSILQCLLGRWNIEMARERGRIPEIPIEILNAAGFPPGEAGVYLFNSPSIDVMPSFGPPTRDNFKIPLNIFQPLLDELKLKLAGSSRWALWRIRVVGRLVNVPLDDYRESPRDKQKEKINWMRFTAQRYLEAQGFIWEATNNFVDLMIMRGIKNSPAPAEAPESRRGPEPDPLPPAWNPLTESTITNLLDQARQVQQDPKAHPSVREQARLLENGYLHLQAITLELLIAYQTVAGRHNLSPGKIRLYLVGGRLVPGNPLRHTSDIDLLFEAENKAQSLGGPPLSLLNIETEADAVREQLQKELIVQLWKICDRLEAPLIYDILAFGGQPDAAPNDTRPRVLLAEMPSSAPTQGTSRALLRALLPIAIPAALLALHHFGLGGGLHAAWAFTPLLFLGSPRLEKEEDASPASAELNRPKLLLSIFLVLSSIYFPIGVGWLSHSLVWGAAAAGFIIVAWWPAISAYRTEIKQAYNYFVSPWRTEQNLDQAEHFRELWPTLAGTIINAHDINVILWLIFYAWPVLKNPSWHLFLGFHSHLAARWISAALLLVLGAGVSSKAYTKHPEEIPWGWPGKAPNGALITSGIYRLMRHPMYLGYSLCWIAFSLIPGVGVYLLLGPRLLQFYIQSWQEDLLCLKKFGLDYYAYAEKTPRYINPMAWWQQLRPSGENQRPTAGLELFSIKSAA